MQGAKASCLMIMALCISASYQVKGIIEHFLLGTLKYSEVYLTEYNSVLEGKEVEVFKSRKYNGFRPHATYGI